MTRPYYGSCLTHPGAAVRLDPTGWCPVCRAADAERLRIASMTQAEYAAERHAALYPDLPPGATIDDDLDGLADELVAEYAAAIERARDDAQLARYGGRDILWYYARLRIDGPRDCIPLTDLPDGTPERDAYHADQYRQAVAQRDAVRQAHR